MPINSKIFDFSRADRRRAFWEVVFEKSWLVVFALLFLGKILSAQCVTGTTVCPTVSPQATYTVCQNAPLTIPSNVSGACARAKCCYNSATSNLSITIVGSHTYVSDLRYWVLNGTGPEGDKSIVLYSAGGVGTNPVTTNDYTGNCNSNNNFNLTFSFSAAAVMPSICSFTSNNPALTGTHRPETAESALDGININEYNWTVQIYDCVGADVGSISSISMTLTNSQCTNQCNGCGGSATAGTVSFTSNTATAINDNTCAPSTAATVGVSPVLPPPVRTVVWNGPGVTNFVGDALSPSTATAGTFVFTVEPKCDGVDCIPCTSNVCGTAAAEKTVTVNVIAPPSAAPTSNSPICVGQTLLFTASGGSTYNWSGPNGFSSTLATPSIPNATTAASGSYSVTVTNSTGCSTVFSTSATVNVPPAAPTISGGPQFCPGTNLTLDAGAGYSSYLWNTTATTQTISTASGGTFSVTVSNAAGCTATASKSVSHFSTPNFGSPITLACPSGGGPAPTTYNFGFSGTWSVVSAPPAASPSVTGAGAVSGMSVPGTYDFQVITSDGCAVTARIVSPPCCAVPTCIPLQVFIVNE